MKNYKLYKKHSIISLLLVAIFAFSVEIAKSASPVNSNYISAEILKKYTRAKKLYSRSHVAAVYDLRDETFILQRNAGRIMSIASLAKIMTAMVLLDAQLDMNEVITITKHDKDRILYAKSRLSFGTKISRGDMLIIALLASANRAASALARTYPGGRKHFVRDMNLKAQELKLTNTQFMDSAGIRTNNKSTARDLVKMTIAAAKYEQIKQYSTMPDVKVLNHRNGKLLHFVNTNRLVRKNVWDISLSKTGFTNKAGNCLIMETEINHRPVIIVLLNSWGKLSRYGDANRIRKWLLKAESRAKAGLNSKQLSL